MKNITTINNIFCGLLIATNTTMAMRKENSPQNSPTPSPKTHPENATSDYRISKIITLGSDENIPLSVPVSFNDLTPRSKENFLRDRHLTDMRKK